MKKFYLLLILCVSFSVFAFAQDVPNKQKIIITKVSATWCPPCGGDAWDNFATLYETYKNSAILMQSHPSRSSTLHSSYAIEFSENLPNAFGQPLFYINREKYTTDRILEKTKNEVASASTASPVANTGIIAQIKGDLEVKTKVKFFKEGNGQYYLSLLVIEDGVIADQANRGSNVAHKNTLRMAMSESLFGEEIANGSITSNSEFTATITKALDPNWNTDNLEVAAILWKKEGDAYEFVNANSVPVAFVSTTSLNLLETTGVVMTVSPSIVKNSATISLNLPEALDNVNLGVYNSLGQEVKSLFSGNLAVGEQTYSIEKSTLNASGVYFLRMEKDGNVISKKFIVE